MIVLNARNIKTIEDWNETWDFVQNRLNEIEDQNTTPKEFSEEFKCLLSLTKEMEQSKNLIHDDGTQNSLDSIS